MPPGCIVHSNEPCCWWISLGERCCFRGQRGLARPECAGLSSPPDMVAQGSSSLRHKAPLHILLYPVHCGGPASRHTAPVPASGLNASPVTGWSQCQFSCWKHSGAQVCPSKYQRQTTGFRSPFLHQLNTGGCQMCIFNPLILFDLHQKLENDTI